jgi:hypothetical protein
MVKVPTVQGNRVQAQELPRERFQYTAPRNFVGKGIEQFGQALGKAADDFNAIEATYDEADALRITNEQRAYERERLRTGSNAYLSTKGFDAGNGMQGTIDDLHKSAENLLTGARSQRARAMAKRSIDQRLGEAEDTIANHSLAEMTTARIGQSEARREGSMNDAVEAYGTDKFAVHLGVAEMETQTLGHLNGWSDDKIKEEVEKTRSSVHRAVVSRLMVDDDVDGAAAYLDAHKGDLLFDDEMAVRRDLKPKLEFRQSEDDAGLVLGLLDDNSVPAPKDSNGDPVASPSLLSQFNAIEGNESGGKQFKDGKPLKSSKGATGVMQVMPGTGPEAAKLAGLKWNPDRLANDEHYNRALGQAYYREMLRRFDGNPELAAAAYNAGPGRVQKVLSDYGEDWENHLPEETRKYVGNFRRKTGIAKGEVGAGMRNAGGKIDATEAYQRLDQIAEEQNWSPERTERARERISVRISRDDALRQREESASWDSALDQVDSLGTTFTDVSQIEGFAKLPADRRIQLRDMAQRNREGGVKPNGDVAVSLGVMAIDEPEKFAATDLREYKSQITPAEFESLRLKQSTIAKSPHQEVSIRSGISSSIGYYSTKDMNLDGEKNKDRRLRVMDAMENYLRASIPEVGSGKRAPSDAEFRKAFDWATAKVVVGENIIGRPVKRERFMRDYYSVPREDRTRISIAYRRAYGRLPTEDELLDYYEDHH